MKRRNFFFLPGIILLVSCVLTACLNLTLPTKMTTVETVITTASESVSPTVSESAATTATENTKTVVWSINNTSKSYMDEDGTVLLELICSFPSLQNADNNPAFTAINDYFGQLTVTALGEAADLAGQAQSARQELQGDFNSWYDSRIGQVAWQSDSYVSITLFSDSYCGGAHPNTLLASVCFDLNTGLTVPLTHFFTLPEVEVTELAVSLIYKEACREDNIFGPMLFDLSEAALSAAFRPDNYYLTDEGFVFYYQPYEIAPYAAGLPAFLIPFADFPDVLCNLE